VKFFANTDANQAELQFDNEVKAAKDICVHPRILQFTKAEEVDDVRYLVYPPTNCTLETVMYYCKYNPLPLHTTFMVEVAVAEALEAIHENNRIHRDLKPDNIHFNCDPPTALKVFLHLHSSILPFSGLSFLSRWIRMCFRGLFQLNSATLRPPRVRNPPPYGSLVRHIATILLNFMTQLQRRQTLLRLQSATSFP
jgi:serine/threonine protein kinase